MRSPTKLFLRAYVVHFLEQKKCANLAHFTRAIPLPHHRPELIPINNNSPLVAVVTDLARDHFHRHADLHVLAVQVGQLGGDHRAFVQLYQCHSVRGVVFEAGRRVADGGERENLAVTAKSEGGAGVIAAVRADVARREDFAVAVWANLTDQCIPLLF